MWLKKTMQGRGRLTRDKVRFMYVTGCSIHRHALRQSIPENTAVSCTWKYIFFLIETVNSDDSWEKRKDG